MESIFKSTLKRRILFTIIDKLKTSEDILNQTEENDRVNLDFRVLSTDLAKRTMRVYVGLYPDGYYSNDAERTWNKTVEFQFLHKNLVVKKGTTLEPVIFDIPLQTGNLRDYPFDKYTTDI
ncbi:hypothetical protein CONCODRAFT_12683, partial [Conidiobolus coronatus NRRL 28638]